MARGGTNRSKRSPGFVYTGLSTALMVLIATLAITASQTPPPAIAELAPEAVEQIKDAPPEQSSELGSAEGGGALGSVTTTSTTAAPLALEVGPAATLPPVRVPRVRKCVGNPPRQTEDPQSPPCVPMWEGDNGGATAKGVTRDEIKLVVPAKKSKNPRNFEALVAHFNSRYEFYGRKLRVEYLDTAGAFTSCAAMKADATKADEEVGGFASIFYDVQGGRETCYYDELARRGIISVHSSWIGQSAATEADLLATGPYQWNYYPSIDTTLRHLAEVVCKQLKGRTAASKPPVARKFGVIVNASGEGGAIPDPAPLINETARCGVPWVSITDDLGPDGKNAPAVKRAITKLKEQSVNSIVCLCFFGVVQQLMATSTPESYYPEWIVQGFQKQDDDHAAGCCYAYDQRAQVIGLRTWNKVLPREEQPYWQALRENDPTHPESEYNFSPDYWNLLLLASGIQTAGPNLTPETFEAGLQRTVFPNPGCGGPPVYQACVSFKGDHSMIDDFALVWYDNNTRSKEWDTTRHTNAGFQAAGTGSFCYVDAGKRYKLGQWPVGDPKVFQGPCQN